LSEEEEDNLSAIADEEAQNHKRQMLLFSKLK
jgi:hypothetical protein